MENLHDYSRASENRPSDAGESLVVPTALARAMSSSRTIIKNISPCVDNGKFPAKRVVGQYAAVEATIFIDGHDQINARLLWREADADIWSHAPMCALGNDRWRSGFVPKHTGMHTFVIEAWFDRWRTYREELAKKIAAGVATSVDIEEGRTLAREIAEHGMQRKSRNVRLLHQLTRQLEFATEDELSRLLLTKVVNTLLSLCDERSFLTRSKPLAIDVERKAAGFASWYELFPRSQTPCGNFSEENSHSAELENTKRNEEILRHGTFDDVIARLPSIHAMGFDVLYFPPIHPIGHTHRKGRNNNLTAQPDDPGSPYAIGSAAGGHEAVHPQLGGIDAFRRLRAAALDYGIEIALDFAVQCSPDHPWLQQHPDWFSWRVDGSIRYAENPPKKYEDIVNVNFYAPGAQPSLWLALRDAMLGWVGEGVKIFRVDNPHTKPLPFWQWVIADIRARHPDVIFLAEAFTRPAMMYELAKVGFSQSYTYFTWRNTKQEITDYLQELSSGPPRDYFRPNFFVNTPDINPYFLQASGSGGFKIRAALAATLSGLWGMYSGFELCEAEPLPGREEYLNSEKYEIKPRDWNAPGNITSLITALNRIRRENPALQTHLGLHFFASGNEHVLYFSKSTEDRSNIILVAISLDPKTPQQAFLEVPFALVNPPPINAKDSIAIKVVDENQNEWNRKGVHVDELHVEELLRGQALVWRGAWQHWYFDPNELPLAIWRIATPSATTDAGVVAQTESTQGQSP